MAENKSSVAVVTGGASGIGRALCERLVRSGWSVLAVDRDEDKLAWTRNKDGIAAMSGDISSEQCNEDMIAWAEAEYGGIDAVVLNAGISPTGSIEEMPMETFDQMVSVNLRGSILGMRAAVPALRRRGGGAILVTGSTFGLGGEASFWAYAATKGGLVGAVKSLAREVGWEGIRVNAVCPGSTRGTALSLPIESHAPEIYDAIGKAGPLQRWAEAEEIAAAMEFLISPASSYINGIALPVDGGAIAGSGLLPPGSAPVELGML